MQTVKIIIAVILVQLSFTTWAQGVVGDWQGDMQVNDALSMKLVFHIKAIDGKYSASFDVPAQHQYDMPFDVVEINDKRVLLKFTKAGIEYSGELIDKQIKGSYRQASFSTDFNLSPVLEVAPKVQRPQEPKAKPSYQIEQVSFLNIETGHKLSGTITSPKGKISHTVILLSGSGPSTRDSVAFGHRIFAVLSDLLTKQGLAVLRFDDRGVGESEGDYKSATSLDFATDANAAVNFVKQHQRLQHSLVGFAGHSEGGLIGAVAATQNKQVDYFVSLAGPGTSGEQILIDQSYKIQKLMGMDEKALAESDKSQRAIMQAISNDANIEQLTKIMAKLGLNEQQIKQQLGQLNTDWFRTFVKTDPKEYLSQLTIPVLALNGSLDVQILAKQNIAGINESVDAQYLTTKVYSGLNHLFQPATTGLPTEYGQIEMTFSPEVVTDVATWIKAL